MSILHTTMAGRNTPSKASLAVMKILNPTDKGFIEKTTRNVISLLSISSFIKLYINTLNTEYIFRIDR